MRDSPSAFERYGGFVLALTWAGIAGVSGSPIALGIAIVIAAFAGAAYGAPKPAAEIVDLHR